MLAMIRAFLLSLLLVATASAQPSVMEVPRPSSSRTTSDESVNALRILDASNISDISHVNHHDHTFDENKFKDIS